MVSQLDFRVLTLVTTYCFYLSTQVSALTCWRCVAHDCELDSSTNIKASQVTCRPGQFCVKVEYRMFDNHTYYESVTRTCTHQIEACAHATEKAFRRCLDTPAAYMINGCAMRSCCSDKDLCNGVRPMLDTISSVVFIAMVCFLLMVVKV